MLHANPHLGKVFMYELDPNNVYRYQSQLAFPQQALIRLQIIDSLVCVHNLDEKTTQLYDLKVAEYSQPLLKNNLTVS